MPDREPSAVTGDVVSASLYAVRDSVALGMDNTGESCSHVPNSSASTFDNLLGGCGCPVVAVSDDWADLSSTGRFVEA